MVSFTNGSSGILLYSFPCLTEDNGRGTTWEIPLLKLRLIDLPPRSVSTHEVSVSNIYGRVYSLSQAGSAWEEQALTFYMYVRPVSD